MSTLLQLAKALGVPVVAVASTVGVVLVHGWRLEGKAEASVQAAVVPVQAQVTAHSSELAVLRTRVESVDSGVRAEVRDVKAEVTQLRISLDKSRDEQRVRDEQILREVRKR